ncbi:hypothetical protein N0V93_009702 [Gnomoniopsis smithogilvyi]|uniref:FAD-binding domain-containing protein n=1 Tax=Gnomoniopsis smithogilvyi TaxID=1191159 RepID=A0A9W9CU19_9PEZI|nr:hypothetical protein N0V93_009702 [Gnomoniopsis smithogilvyi]
MSNLKVLVVGASIAGPSAAYWLAKAGAHVTVIERFPKLRTSGQNIDIRSCGVTVMRKMAGMEEAVRAAVLEMEGVSFVNDKGEPLAIMRATGDADAQFLVSEYEIYRGELSRIIVDLTKDNDRINYVFGEQVVAMHQTEDSGPITVEFANGMPAAEYDLVVACDGATSRTRAIGFGYGVRDHIVPMNTWAAYCNIEEDLLDGVKLGKAWSAPGACTVTLSPRPSSGTQILYMSVHTGSKDQDPTKPFREASKKGDDALKAYVAERFQAPGWKSKEIMAGMMKSDDFYASEWMQVKLPKLYQGRFVTVGDAGYATGPTGGGTSLAMAGAYVLAGELSTHKGDLAAGLEAYERRMRPIIDDLQKIPPGVLTFMAPQTAWGIWLRNQVFKLVCWTMKFKGLFAWASKYMASAFGGDNYNLPDYQWEY